MGLPSTNAISLDTLVLTPPLAAFPALFLRPSGDPGGEWISYETKTLGEVQSTAGGKLVFNQLPQAVNETATINFYAEDTVHRLILDLQATQRTIIQTLQGGVTPFTGFGWQHTRSSTGSFTTSSGAFLVSVLPAGSEVNSKVLTATFALSDVKRTPATRVSLLAN